MYGYVCIGFCKAALEGQEIRPEIAQECTFPFVNQKPNLYISCVIEIFTFALDKKVLKAWDLILRKYNSQNPLYFNI